MADVLEIVKILLWLYCALCAGCVVVYLHKAHRVDGLDIRTNYIRAQVRQTYIDTAVKCTGKLIVSVLLLAVMIYVTGV